MKWRESAAGRGEMWYTGPWGEKKYTARKGGKVYTVVPAYEKPFARSGNVVWWSLDGNGTNKCWRTPEAAKAWCERDAGVIPQAHDAQGGGA